MNTFFRHLLFGVISILLAAFGYAETVETRNSTGYASFIHSDTPTSLASLTGLPKAFRRGGLSQDEVGDLFIQHYASNFGISDRQQELRHLKTQLDDAGNSMQHYQQRYLGIPVLGAELRVNLDQNQALRSINGQISPYPSLDVTPRVTPLDTLDIARTAIKKWYFTLDVDQFVFSEPELAIYDPRLFSNHISPARLVWQLEATGSVPYPIKEWILVDAKTGGILLHFNQSHTALNRETYTANHNVEQENIPLPLTLVCNESDPSCSSGDADAQAAHAFAEDTYNFFFSKHARDSFDDQGGTITSITHYGSNLQNAFWDSDRAIFGDGLARLDDVVAHELTHAFTEATSNLYYYDQSGAINESLSDLWGEFIDLENGAGDDSASVRWEIGEDAPLYTTISRSLRDMQNPTRFSNPDKMTSSFYYTGSADNRGVHINSGVNNKAVTLLVDGGAFNGKTISALGINKVSAIYYEAQTKLLGQTSTYPDLYVALQQACSNLLASGTTSSNDCEQVKNALDAVEMNIDPVANLRPQANQCAATEIISNLYSTGFEGTVTDWESITLSGTIEACKTTSDNPKSGSQAAFCNDIDSSSDTVWQQKNEVTLPANAYLHFHHNYLFEPEFDYGLLEYTTNNGTSWQSAHSFYDAGKQADGVIEDVTSFNGHSLGYVSSRYNLSSLSGQKVRFRFRVVTDLFVGAYGWLIDDLSIYTCSGVDTTPDAFSFAAKDDVSLNTQQISSSATITGINNDTVISVTNGEYRINGGNFTTNNGTVKNNDSVELRHTSSSDYSGITSSTLTIGSVQAVFKSTTLSDPAATTSSSNSNTTTTNLTNTNSSGGGAFQAWLLLLIGFLSLLAKRKTQRHSSAF